MWAQSTHFRFRNMAKREYKWRLSILGTIRRDKRDAQTYPGMHLTLFQRVNDSDARWSVAKRPRHDESTFPGHGANRDERWTSLPREF